MAAKALLFENPSPTRRQIAEWLTGNICRCGAYGAIATSILEAAVDYRAAGSMEQGARSKRRNKLGMDDDEA
jgi:xanthine dehydrogenase iron-sulfur cluster and FAD-binding subunit A